jgi:8-oxo-dGTP pyrophosphatase MutT (NUDIX family)
MEYDIYKSGGIIIENKKLLLTKSKGKDVYVAPGGKLEANETPKGSLVRELKEELNLDIAENDLEEFGDFYANAAGNEDRLLRMDVFVVKKYSGKIEVGREVEEIAWVDSNIPKGMLVGSIFEHEVIPRLKKEGLIN